MEYASLGVDTERTLARACAGIVNGRQLLSSVLLLI